MSRVNEISRRLLLGMALLLPSCDGIAERPVKHESTELGAGVLARVGPLSIERDDLSLWTRGETPDFEVLIADTLLSLESIRTAPHRAAVIRRAGLARALVEELESETLRRTPLSSAELDHVRADHWLRFDRPRAVRSAAIRVPVPPLADDGPYKELATRLHEAAAQAHNLESLIVALDQVETDFEVQRMRMPPVASDGRVVPVIPQDFEMEQVHPSFAQQATALNRPGELSPVFPGPDSYQFIFAVEVIEEERGRSESARRQMQKLALSRRLEKPLSELKSIQDEKPSYSGKDLGALLGLVWRK